MKFSRTFLICPYFKKKVDKNFCFKCFHNWENPCQFPKPYLQFLWENPHEDLVEKEDFSVTSILRCPMQIYLFNQYGYIIDPTYSSASVIGKLNHFALETIIKNYEEKDKKFVIERKFNISFYIDKEKKKKVRLWGKPDLIIVNKDKSLVIVDWKNTFFVNFAPFKKHLFQLYTYAFILETRYKSRNVKVSKGIIYYLGEKFKRAEFDFSENKKKIFFPILYNWIKYRISLIIEILENKINYSDSRLMPSPSDCFYCSVYDLCKSPFKNPKRIEVNNIIEEKNIENLLLKKLKKAIIF